MAILNSDAFKKMFTYKQLLRTWIEIRNALKAVEVRDCLDYIEYQIETRERLLDLRQRVLSGAYEPAIPSRYENAKSSGSYRIITIPELDDLIVYRLISDQIYSRARVNESPSAFYSRRHGMTPVGQKVGWVDSADYEKFFPVWRRYNQYRSRTLLHGLYDVLVITDISNYFDSIQHSLLFEYLMPLGLPRESIGLLGRLLLALRPQSGFSPTPQMGLPVDEYDCSRQIAHVFLFEHDQRVINAVGGENYVRWMDDQNIGVQGRTRARQVVHLLTSSLAEQRLTLNTGKTKVLSPDEVAIHFHLEANELLDQVDADIKAGAKTRHQLIQELDSAWIRALVNGNRGNWDKILKRMYGLGAILRSPIMGSRSYEDLVGFPTLANRIFEYYIARGAYIGLIDLFERYVQQGECIHESVALAFFEIILSSDPPTGAKKRLRALAKRVLDKTWPPDLGSYPKSSAALCLYWLGDKKSASVFRRLVQTQGRDLPEGVVRALIAGAAALDPDKIGETLTAAVRVGKPDVASLATTVSRLRSGNIKEIDGSRILFPRYSWPLQRNVYDARMWLRLETLAFAASPKIIAKVNKEITRLKTEPLTSTEKRCLTRLMKRMRKVSPPKSTKGKKKKP